MVSLLAPGPGATPVPPAQAQEAGGLSGPEVEARRSAGQVNRAAPSPQRTLAQILRANVLTRFNAILGGLLVVVAVVGPAQDGLFGVVLVVNTAIGVVQELRARRTLERLAILNAPRARVVRDGRLLVVDAEDVVLDDVLALEPGDQLVADGEVMKGDGLELDESFLSGESEPVAKAGGAAVLSGSFVVAGTGRARATGIGSSSYAAGLEAEARRFSLVRSELQQGTNQILRLVTWVMVPTGAALAVTQVLRSHQALGDALRGSVAGVAAMVPEGLVLLTSIAFAVGAMRLASRRVLVQELPAVEGLARVDTLCIDKTGTLTSPDMRLASRELCGSSHAGEIDSVLAAMAAADPAPNATLRALGGSGRGMVTPAVEGHVAFSSARKWSAVSLAGSGTWALGAPEVLLDADDPVLRRARAIQETGQRVLVLARSPEPLTESVLPTALAPMALVALEEELRPDAVETVGYLVAQGIRVQVLSGDAPETVAHVAKRVGIPVPAPPVDATHLDAGEGLAVALSHATVLGRVRPEQKVAAVEALQRQGHVVAMVGDGVNDVQALKQADLGIAMGSGSQSSRSVARILLLDSAFSAVPQVLAEGRRVVANIERVASLFVSKTVYAALLAAVVALTAVPYPFFPRHLTIVSTLTIGVPGFFLALAAGAPRARPGFTRRVLAFSVPAGIVAASATFAAYAIARGASGTTLVQAKTTAMLALYAVGIWILVVVARPLDALRVVLVVAMAAGIALPFASSFTRRVFGLQLAGASLLVEASAVVAGSVLVLTCWRRCSGRSRRVPTSPDAEGGSP